jgi:hypothetical protein
MYFREALQNKGDALKALGENRKAIDNYDKVI